MKTYIVTWEPYDEDEFAVIGVYSSYEKAFACVERQDDPEEFVIHEREVDCDAE